MTDPLEQFCSPRQLEVLRAVAKYGSQRKAATSLGMGATTLRCHIAAIEKKAAIQGYSPECQWTHPVPPTHVAKGVSTYFEKTDTTPAAWVKADLRQEAYNEIVQGAIASFLEDVPKLEVTAAPLDFQSDIIPWIQIGDSHLGMLAHMAETTQNFDLKIAEAELCTAIAMLVDEMPNCERVCINDLGDFTHYSNYKGETNANGNKLDYDGRFPKMIKVYSRIMRFIVEKVLEKAKFIDVIINQGNHSEENDVWMAELLRVAYGHTGRVNVLDNDNIFIGYRMGNTFVMTNHSQKCPPARLVGVMTTDFRKDYGETEFHYIDVGHRHTHFVSNEYPGIIIESWNNLPPNDKWAHDGGYRSRRSITIVLRSKEFGDLGRRVLPIEQVRRRIALRAGAATERQTHSV